MNQMIAMNMRCQTMNTNRRLQIHKTPIPFRICARISIQQIGIFYYILLWISFSKNDKHILTINNKRFLFQLEFKYELYQEFSIFCLLLSLLFSLPFHYYFLFSLALYRFLSIVTFAAHFHLIHLTISIASFSLCSRLNTRLPVSLLPELCYA